MPDFASSSETPDFALSFRLQEATSDLREWTQSSSSGGRGKTRHGRGQSGHRPKARQSSIGTAYRRHSKELFQPWFCFADVAVNEDSNKGEHPNRGLGAESGSRIDVGKTPIRHEGVSAWRASLPTSPRRLKLRAATSGLRVDSAVRQLSIISGEVR